MYQNKAGVHPGPSLTEHLSRISHMNCCCSLTLGTDKLSSVDECMAGLTRVEASIILLGTSDTSMIELKVLAGMEEGWFLVGNASAQCL